MPANNRVVLKVPLDFVFTPEDSQALKRTGWFVSKNLLARNSRTIETAERFIALKPGAYLVFIEHPSDIWHEHAWECRQMNPREYTDWECKE
jgi:hypothetical protein